MPKKSESSNTIPVASGWRIVVGPYDVLLEMYREGDKKVANKWIGIGHFISVPQAIKQIPDAIVRLPGVDSLEKYLAALDAFASTVTIGDTSKLPRSTDVEVDDLLAEDDEDDPLDNLLS